jgi:hypothetical protein
VRVRVRVGVRVGVRVRVRAQLQAGTPRVRGVNRHCALLAFATAMARAWLKTKHRL